MHWLFKTLPSQTGKKKAMLITGKKHRFLRVKKIFVCEKKGS
jgi:hypothetical protein